MALPPIDMSAELEDTEETGEPEEGSLEDMDEDMAEGEGVSSDLDPMFAADAAEAFPDFDDAQLAALQRAILSLISSGGAPPAPAGPAPMMGF